MLQYKAMSGATARHRYVLTYGAAEGRVVSGHFGTTAMTPMPGLCASTYRVRAILTENDGRELTRYGVPVYRGQLTGPNMREIELCAPRDDGENPFTGQPRRSRRAASVI